MATTKEVGVPQPMLLTGDPPTGAAIDGTYPLANLVSSKDPDAVGSPASNVSEGSDSKLEKHEAPQRSKGKVALIMSALCVSFALPRGLFLW
jgi:hypothetical protein